MIKLKVIKSEPSSRLGNIMRDTTVGESYKCTKIPTGSVDPYGNEATCDALAFEDDQGELCVVYANSCTLYEVTYD